jgi:hypothetical protein
VYFAHLGLDYIYELEGFKLPDGSYYLPDFWLPMFQCWAEVKPRPLEPHEFYKCAQLPEGCLILDSRYPDVLRAYFYTGDPHDHTVSYDAYISDSRWYRVMLAQSRYKGRLWFLLGELPSDYAPSEREMHAVRAARQARFEYGEQPEPVQVSYE